jgi:alkanesulfonate monooxygenase SsuD/methylene tetrahydromethanopterin reductase-like flavin-dependent oxidoreductase (luciferase family)
MLLWGGGSSKASARRAQQYAEGIVEKLDNKE